MTGHVLAAPDKFRGTATAPAVARAIAAAAQEHGWTSEQVPMADGGEGTLDVVGGPNRSASVTGPDGAQRQARFFYRDGQAVIEMAAASGLDLVGGADNNDPLEATSKGTGELIAEAMRLGADEIIVGVGGSATTDGGLGAVKALWPHSRLRGIDLVVATDVDTLFVDAARLFAPQKGATPAQVKLLEGRLRRVAAEYQSQFDVDVTKLAGSGAGGGLAGGLAAVGARIVPGFELLADIAELDASMESADLVVTGEGLLDAQSAMGKVVGGTIAMSRRMGKPVLVIAGEVDLRGMPEGWLDGVAVVSLLETFGEERAFADTTACVHEAVAAHLRKFSTAPES